MVYSAKWGAAEEAWRLSGRVMASPERRKKIRKKRTLYGESKESHALSTKRKTAVSESAKNIGGAEGNA